MGLLILLASPAQVKAEHLPQVAQPSVQPTSEQPTEQPTPAQSTEEQAQQQAGWERLRTRLRLSPRRQINTPPPADAFYLYGQQPVANQLGTTYFVFESTAAEGIIGAFYMPSSSFDCVRGSMNDSHIALAITDSYTKQIHTYALALNEPFINVASNSQSGLQTTIRTPPSIEGFYPLPVSESDRALLATCQAII